MQEKAAPSIDQLFDRRDIMVPARDGAKLFTVILTPKGLAGPLPILLRRTPYGAGGGASAPGLIHANEDLEKPQGDPSHLTHAGAAFARGHSGDPLDRQVLPSCARSRGLERDRDVPQDAV